MSTIRDENDGALNILALDFKCSEYTGGEKVIAIVPMLWNCTRNCVCQGVGERLGEGTTEGSPNHIKEARHSRRGTRNQD